MLKLVVVAFVIVCVSSSVVPKPPAPNHGEVKHDMVKSTPMHHDHHPSSEKPAEVKANIKQDEKAKSISHHDMKSDEKKDTHHQSETKKVDHHDNHDHHAALKHHDVPVNVGHGHGDKGVHDVLKPEKVETKAKASDHRS